VTLRKNCTAKGDLEASGGAPYLRRWPMACEGFKKWALRADRERKGDLRT